jgi:hypothetical protein
MLHLVDYNSNRTVLIYADCNSTLNKGRVLSSRLKSSVDNTCSSPSNSTTLTLNQEQTLNLVNGGNAIPYNFVIQDRDIAKFDFIVYLSPLYTLEGYGDDFIEGSGILNDFIESTHVLINSVEYEINRNLSTENKVYVKAPIQGSVTSYQVPVVYKEFLFPHKFLLEKSINMIASISTSCCEAIDKPTEYVIKYTALQTAIKCCDKASAIDLFNLLKSWT